MKSIAIFISLIGVLQCMNCESGGPSAYGYDASSVCNKPYNSRSSRAYLENLPCDFRHQNWCTVAGSSYPWHAVRRFVQENQGLMRRMYGIERHIDILKAEFEKNDVELEYDDRYERYLDETRRYRDNFGIYDEDELLAMKRYSRNGKLPKRYGDSSKFYHRKSKAVETSSTTTSTSTVTPIESSSKSKKEDDFVSTMTAKLTTEVPAETTTDFDRNDVEAEKVKTTVSYEVPNLENEESNSTTTSEPYVDDLERLHNLSINEIPGQINRLDADVEELIEIPEDQEVNSTGGLPLESKLKDDTESFVDSNKENFSSTRKPEVQQFRPRPEYKPSENKQSTLKPEITETQNNQQDVDSKNNQHREAVLKLRGINACPVKDEVVAPLWANNTRGEILALINHYPFEQYVHWEKCTHENKQMYCRDGCRCEQQYRLHRLLAFDPNNECRGIFSDWFKFPSCCVCRCYDLPMEFRVTSRSPRVLKRKIKIRTSRY